MNTPEVLAEHQLVVRLAYLPPPTPTIHARKQKEHTHNHPKSITLPCRPHCTLSFNRTPFFLRNNYQHRDERLTRRFVLSRGQLCNVNCFCCLQSRHVAIARTQYSGSTRGGGDDRTAGLTAAARETSAERAPKGPWKPCASPKRSTESNTRRILP
jgi:hypothetical protein